MRNPAYFLSVIAVVPLATVQAGDKAPMANYYEYEAPAVPAAPVRAPQAKPIGKGRSLVVDKAGSSENESKTSKPSGDIGAESSAAGSTVALPARMEKGVKDLEAGMEDLQRYTATMAAHIQKNGMRGFLALPADLKEQGRVIGRSLGGGINGVASDVAQDMIAPDVSDSQ
jgi:hypothetical protein